MIIIIITIIIIWQAAILPEVLDLIPDNLLDEAVVGLQVVRLTKEREMDEWMGGWINELKNFIH